MLITNLLRCCFKINDYPELSDQKPSFISTHELSWKLNTAIKYFQKCLWMLLTTADMSTLLLWYKELGAGSVERSPGEPASVGVFWTGNKWGISSVIWKALPKCVITFFEHWWITTTPEYNKTTWHEKRCDKGRRYWPVGFSHLRFWWFGSFSSPLPKITSSNSQRRL